MIDDAGIGIALDDARSPGPVAADGPELVSVIIPAFNAADYIDRTLRSVRAQTHDALEILVVDDGSTDDTAQIVRRHAAADARIRLIQQGNHGVAAARNRGIGAAAGEYVAPIDADDLWAPDKIALQLRAARSTPVPAGIVYSWYVLIDADDRIRMQCSDLPDQDDVLRRMCRNNIVGSGSAPLLLRRAVLDAGGYDQTLQDRDAQGCEDYKLYFALMERHPVAFVPAYLTAYRVHLANMSSDIERMLRSRRIVTSEIIARRPELRHDLERGHVRLMRFLVARSIRSGDYLRASRVMAQMFGLNRRAAAHECGMLLARGFAATARIGGRWAGIRTRARFVIGDPAPPEATVAA